MNKKILKLLYRSFDEVLSEKKQHKLDKALKKSVELQREKTQVERLRKVVSGSTVNSFRPLFAERVINSLNAPGKKADPLDIFYLSLKAVFRRFAVAGAALCTVLILYNLGKGESLTVNEAFSVSKVTLEEILSLPLF